MSRNVTPRSLISLDRTAPFLISDAPTAPERSSFAPTLLRSRVLTAYEVPPSAMNTAIVAMTFAYERCDLMRLM